LRPSEEQRVYYSGKSKHHEIKYEVGVDVRDGTIVWLSGGFPGSMHDLTIARTSGIIDKLDEGEFILADKAYLGDQHFLTPLKGTPSTLQGQLFNYIISHLRIIVEHTFSKIKVFKCLTAKWRHDLCLHKVVFFVLSNVINFELKTK
jgi:hypothetical protein